MDIKKTSFLQYSFIIIITVLIMGIIPINGKEKLIKGKYMGEPPPELKAKVFAKGFISTEANELNSVFSPDGKEFFFARRENQKYTMYFSEQVDGYWIPVQKAPFSGNYQDVDMTYSPDGKKLFFCSIRLINGKTPNGWKIWYLEKTKDNTWSEPYLLDSPINKGERAIYPTFSKKGNMYFQGKFADTIGGSDIYKSILSNGKYLAPINLGTIINSPNNEGDVYIAPDESYMIVNKMNQPDGYGDGDLYISFKKLDNTWTKPYNMGPEINSSTSDYCPQVTTDGNYFFWTSKRTGNGDIYWISSKIIEELKNQIMK